MAHSQEPIETYCQSCGALMSRAKEFGTDASGAHVADYCRRCFERGTFVEPNLTFEQLLERFEPAGGRTAESALPSHHPVHFLQTLDRWRAPASPRRDDATGRVATLGVRKSMR